MHRAKVLKLQLAYTQVLSAVQTAKAACLGQNGLDLGALAEALRHRGFWVRFSFETYIVGSQIICAALWHLLQPSWLSKNLVIEHIG